MFKKIMLLAVTAAAALAVSAPAASAFWHHEGSPIQADATLHPTGTLGFTSPNGGVHCPNTTAKIKLTAGTTIGHVEIFNPSANGNLAECKISGGLAFLGGGTTSLSASNLTSATVEAVGDHINIYNIVLHNTFKSGLLLTLTSTGTGLTVDPDDPSEINHLVVSGKLHSSLGGEVTVAGELTPTPGERGTYGVTP